MNAQTNQDLELDIKVRAQFLRNLFARLTMLLRIHSEGYLLILSEEVDDVYIRLRSSVENIVETEGMESLASVYPKDTIPVSLHSLGEDADILWDSLRGALQSFTGRIIEFCISVGADNSNIDSAISGTLSSYDEFIEAFKKDKKTQEALWLQRSKAEGKRIRDQFSQQMGSKENPDKYVNISRLAELRAIKSTVYDLTRLIELCEELNKAFANQSYMAVMMLVRAVLDHVPPMFSCKNFAEVANNYSGGSKSFKQSMANLESSSRKIADAHLHTQIRNKEVLPNKTQVNFSNDLDVLLAEIVRLLK
jgi:hypothetical protein